jgi:ABC-type iron transport system FetAB permease component
LIIASFCYVILLYGVFLLPQNWLEASSPIVILLAIIGELSIGIGLLWKGLRNEIPEMKYPK